MVGLSAVQVGANLADDGLPLLGRCPQQPEPPGLVLAGAIHRKRRGVQLGHHVLVEAEAIRTALLQKRSRVYRLYEAYELRMSKVSICFYQAL